MPKPIQIEENGLFLWIQVTDQGDVRLLHFSSVPFLATKIADEQAEKHFRLVEIQLSGENQHTHHGAKYRGTMPGNRLIYTRHHDYRNEHGRKLEVVMKDPIHELAVTSHFQWYDRIQIVRAWTEVQNNGEQAVGIEYVSSFALTGIDKEGLKPWNEKMNLHVPHHSWYGEGQWKSYSLPDLGLYPVNSFSLKRINFSSVGTWSSSEFIPMGYLENSETGNGLIWQIEHNGSWQWEISDVYGTIDDQPGLLYLQLSGPTQNESHWWKSLSPEESFLSVPVAVGSVQGGFDQAIGQMTMYRRAIRRENKDNQTLPIIFNDYMNCLLGDPTTEKLLPLIDAAAEAGCEYFCIDCGWYSDGIWWDGVGEWQPSKQRFPGGIEKVLKVIREKGMLPGLWLEIEVMGIKCEKADRVSDDWFFKRHGKRVIDHGRYQLDFRHPEVIQHANEVIDRLVHEYKVGYIKMDYNINGGIGTELRADSFGDGLLEHNRAYLSWLDSVFERYPNLVLENCASGGMRMDYALLSRHSLQSTSDQMDYRKYAYIAANAPSILTPEQSAVWSYPLMDGDDEAVIFTMVNSMLMRIHQSGHLGMITKQELELVKEALAYYKAIRENIPYSLPFWPLGLAQFGDGWASLGLRTHHQSFLAVWRLDSPSHTISLPLPFLSDSDVSVKVGYPASKPSQWSWHAEASRLSVTLPERYQARLFELNHR